MSGIDHFFSFQKQIISKPGLFCVLCGFYLTDENVAGQKESLIVVA